MKYIIVNAMSTSTMWHSQNSEITFSSTLLGSFETFCRTFRNSFQKDSRGLASDPTPLFTVARIAPPESEPNTRGQGRKFLVSSRRIFISLKFWAHPSPNWWAQLGFPFYTVFMRPASLTSKPSCNFLSTLDFTHTTYSVIMSLSRVLDEQ